MNKIIALLLVLSACSLNVDQLKPPKLYPGNGMPKSSLGQTFSLTGDYTNNLVEEWVGNRGFAPIGPYVNSWMGNIAHKQTSQTGSPAIPSNAILTLGSGDTFKWNTTTYTAFSGDATIVYRLRKQTSAANQVFLFDGVGTTPRTILYLRASGANSSMAISENGVLHSVGVTFPCDGNFHTLAFRLNGTTGSIYLDNGQAGSSFLITGGAPNFSQGKTVVLAQGPQGAFGDNVEIKKIRVYNEYVSDADMSTVNSGDFLNDITDSSNWIVDIHHGQSNATGVNSSPNPGNLITDYSVQLRSGFSDVFLWNFVSNKNNLIPIPAGQNTYLAGSRQFSNNSFLRVAYDLRQKFPTDSIVMNIYGVTATDLATDWAVGGALYNGAITTDKNLLTRLAIEQRNIRKIVLTFIQGEKDGNTLANANAYGTNLANWMTSFKNDLGINPEIIIVLLRSNVNTYATTVRAGQLAFIASDTVNIKGIDPNYDPSCILHGLNNGADCVSSPIHYYAPGYEELGRREVQLIN